MSDESPKFPPDEYLSTVEIQELHGVLKAQLEDLINESRGDLRDLTVQREQDSDELDLAVTESNRDFTLRLADRERRMIRKIQKALDRIRSGEYGTCESCGAPITYNRLMARPVATLCIDCKTEAEQLERPRRAFV